MKVTIAALEAAGRLTRFVPRIRGAPRRACFLTEKALHDLNDAGSAVNVLTGKASIMNALTTWTSGGLVAQRRPGKCGFLCRLVGPPPEIWEIRVTQPVVQARLFGRFAEPDAIVLTNFHTRRMLGDKGSPNWKLAMETCEKSWNDLFASAKPFAGTTIREYVTENCDDVPI